MSKTIVTIPVDFYNARNGRSYSTRVLAPSGIKRHVEFIRLQSQNPLLVVHEEDGDYVSVSVPTNRASAPLVQSAMRMLSLLTGVSCVPTDRAKDAAIVHPIHVKGRSSTAGQFSVPVDGLSLAERLRNAPQDPRGSVLRGRVYFRSYAEMGAALLASGNAQAWTVQSIVHTRVNLYSDARTEESLRREARLLHESRG